MFLPPKLTRPTTWYLERLLPSSPPTPADETASHGDHATLGEVLGARVRARAERRHVDEQRRLVTRVVDSQPQSHT